jgi:hypothetical protein
MPNATKPRTSEWFVPAFGPSWFRSFLGLLFLPYTGMVLSFLVLGTVLAPRLTWHRLVSLEVIYFLALGLGAHALDALGSGTEKPWGAVFTRTQLWSVVLCSLVPAYAIAIYYMVFFAPLLWPLALVESFFVFAYNMEWFGGRFHRDGWFAFSWGFLPVLAGYVMQTNHVSAEVFVVASGAALLSMVEIKASRPYKDLKRRSTTATGGDVATMRQYEAILKSVSLGVIVLAAGLLLGRVLP